MTNTTTPTADYLADCYDRLRNNAEIIAADPGVAESELIEARFLGGLSEYDANTVSLLVSLDSIRGLTGWRGVSIKG